MCSGEKDGNVNLGHSTGRSSQEKVKWKAVAKGRLKPENVSPSDCRLLCICDVTSAASSTPSHLSANAVVYTHICYTEDSFCFIF